MLNNSILPLTPNESAIYYPARVPGLKRGRGRCPIHKGKRDSLAVNMKTGNWYCFSQCGRGGDVFAFEMALNNCSFPEAKRAVFDLIGRFETPFDRSEDARNRAANVADIQAAGWWSGAFVQLAEETLAEMESTDPARGLITDLLLSAKQARGESLLDLYRSELAREPKLTAALVYAGRRAIAEQESKNNEHAHIDRLSDGKTMAMYVQGVDWTRKYGPGAEALR